MKNVCLLAVLLLTLVSCGSSSNSNGTTCSSGFVGTWRGTTLSDSIQITSDGKFDYTGVDGCTSSGTYACPGNITTGSITITITSATASPDCTSAGSYVCLFTISGSTLAFQVTNGSQVSPLNYYTKE